MGLDMGVTEVNQWGQNKKGFTQAKYGMDIGARRVEWMGQNKRGD